MQIHNISSKTKRLKGRRIGRGGKRGTYSGRGVKGQHARAGAKFFPIEREILKKIPKLRGRGKHLFTSFRPKPAVVGMRSIENKFKSGDTISPKSLFEAGLVRKIGGKMPKVKILAGGDKKTKFVFKDVFFSRGAGLK